jgi:large subunit ribosomal protein L27
MAHKKAGGSSRNGRDSAGKRLGVKKYGGELVKAGNVLVRQRGTTVHAGDGAYLGRDYTVHAAVEGHIFFREVKGRQYVGVKASA